MSRSNPTDGIRNPSTRWFEWAGGSEGGYIRWYEKESKEYMKVPNFTFLLLDELSTVKGWHEASESGIYANEVRDTRQDVLVVKSFKGGELASGIYSDIRDRIIALGGHYSASIYIAYKEGDAYRIGNLQLKGAASGAWMEFKKSAPTKKNADGKNLRAYFVDAIKVVDFEQAKKGGTIYRIPKFAFVESSQAANHQASALDTELQAYLDAYLKTPKAEAEGPGVIQRGAKPDHFDDIPLPDEAPPMEEETSIPF